MEIKCLKFFVDRVRRTYFINSSIDLKVIIVNDHNQIVQFAESCPHGSFPDLAFLDLTVSAECIDTVIFFVKLSGCCHSGCCGESLSQRTG